MLDERDDVTKNEPIEGANNVQIGVVVVDRVLSRTFKLHC
jgi:hypothetical protein